MLGNGFASPASIPSRILALGALISALALGWAASPAESVITVGPGPSIGTDRAGATWYQDFQDWTHSDLRALDDAGLGDAVYAFGDGYDDSRDLIAFYYRAEGDYLYFRADLYDLALGAEQSNLNLYVAIDWRTGGQLWLPDFLDVQTDTPWEACLAIYQSGTTLGSSYNLWDESFNVLSGGYAGSYFNSQLDAVEFGIQRAKLTALGWDGASVLRFQVFTTKDNTETSCTGGGRSSDITDSVVDDDRGCSDGVLNGSIPSTDGAGLVYYASIAHGNQSVNRAGDIGAHIYDPQSNTGISGGTGFLRTLDTHEIFKVPLNIHPSGTLTVACNWATRPTGAADPQDGPAFLARIREFVDADQSTEPGFAHRRGARRAHHALLRRGRERGLDRGDRQPQPRGLRPHRRRGAGDAHAGARDPLAVDRIRAARRAHVRGHRREPLCGDLSRRDHPPPWVVLSRRVLPARPGLSAQAAQNQRRLLFHDQRPRGPGEVREPRRRHGHGHALQPAPEVALRKLERDGRCVRRLGGAGREVVRSQRGDPDPQQQPESIPHHDPLGGEPSVDPHLESERRPDHGPGQSLRVRDRPRLPVRPRHPDLRMAQARLRELVQLLVLQPECRVLRQRAGLLQPGAGDHRSAGRLSLARRHTRQRRTAASRRHEARRSQHAGDAHVRSLGRGGRRACGPAQGSGRVVLPRHDLRDRVARRRPGRLLRHRLLWKLGLSRQLLGRREHLGAAASEPRPRDGLLRRSRRNGRRM